MSSIKFQMNIFSSLSKITLVVGNSMVLTVSDQTSLKAVCHVADWPLQTELNTTDFFVNLCI